MQGNTTLLVQLVSLYPKHVDGGSDLHSDGQAPLLAAALMGQVRSVEMLLSAGARVDRRGRREETALMLASQRGHIDVLRVLLACGAQLTAADQRGWTALHYAAFSGQVASIQALLAPGPGRVDLLDAKNTKGETALALAAFGRKDDCCKALITAGAQPSLVADATDRDYALKLKPASAEVMAEVPTAAAAADGDVDGVASVIQPASGGDGGAGGAGGAKKRGPRLAVLAVRNAAANGGSPAAGPSANLSARPGIQFSGTLDEYERIITPQPSEPPSTLDGPFFDLGAGGGFIKAAGRGGGGSPPRHGSHPAWKLHEYSHKGVPFLVHRPTGLLFTSVPEDSFPHLVGSLAGGGVPRWLGESDLLLVEGTPQALETLASTIPAAELLLKQLNVIPEPVLRLVLLLGVHEVSELRDLIQLEPYSVRYEAAWRPAGLPPGHLAQLRPLLRAELLRPRGQSGGGPDGGGSLTVEDDLLAQSLAMGTCVAVSESGDDELLSHASWLSGLDPTADSLRRKTGTSLSRPRTAAPAGEPNAPADPLPISLAGLPLVQHVLQRYGLTKLLVQVAEHQITSPADLPLLANPRRLQPPGWPSFAAGPPPALTPAETGRLSRMIRELPGLLTTHARERERAETEAAVGPLLEAAERQRRVDALARPIRGSLVAYDDLDGVGGGPAAAAAGGRRPLRAAVVLQEDTAGGRFIVRDLESDRILSLLVGHIRKIRASDAAKLVRPDYAPPASPGVPVTPLAAAPGLLVTRGIAWGRGPQYDLYGDGVVGELLGPDLEVAAEAADGGGFAWYSERWRVRWPDGCEYSYSVGEDGAFELSFWGLHWRSGAPLLDFHRSLLLPPGEVAVLPVCRGPAWADEPHDGLPGSLGAALLDRSTPTLAVDWLRSLHAPRAYQPSAGSGAYPLLHAAMGGQPVTLFTARPGARVDPSALPPQAAAGGSPLAGEGYYLKSSSGGEARGGDVGGSGTLLAPVRLEDGGTVVVWLVSWPTAGRMEARGAEGRLVRVNPSQLALQPGAASGPLRPTGRSDVGVVLRDLGPGVHCGLLVRQLNGCTAFWYDEDVLLPLTQVEQRRLPAGAGAAAAAAAAAVAGGASAVPVLDCTAAPGMMVRRCFDDGSTLRNAEKEQQIGQLVAPVSLGRWLVRWPDGTSAIYPTGAGSKFQLSYVTYDHPQYGM
ncbi:hypothetical protein GPECTOR_169g184 [Gonium pectorale]|uniref:Uncharacterized protein n=1 Tax=Gonium pectorale TaxID=33097 RepID=A0A150FYZ8_GONPE|nr:hypothetical protein GPECTOR_169g184 [Gonium pectorale]|eukprot:KXZ42280.1 hypothetical protein GPECTOR_169g184 [Gonium pectorale]